MDNEQKDKRVVGFERGSGVAVSGKTKRAVGWGNLNPPGRVLFQRPSFCDNFLLPLGPLEGH
jgi:hypothetical protein